MEQNTNDEPGKDRAVPPAPKRDFVANMRMHVGPAEAFSEALTSVAAEATTHGPVTDPDYLTHVLRALYDRFPGTGLGDEHLALYYAPLSQELAAKQSEALGGIKGDLVIYVSNPSGGSSFASAVEKHGKNYEIQEIDTSQWLDLEQSIAASAAAPGKTWTHLTELFGDHSKSSKLDWIHSNGLRTAVRTLAEKLKAQDLELELRARTGTQKNNKWQELNNCWSSKGKKGRKSRKR